jgi:hypothetical protein
MARWLWLLPLAGLLGLALVTSQVAAVRGGQEDGRQVYTVAAVRAGLHQDPGAWVGRRLRVGGVALPCEDMLAVLTAPRLCGLPVLEGGTGVGERGSLLLGLGQPDPIYARLRAIPLVGRLLPAPATFRWGVPATYTVRIVALPDALPGTLRDYEALLDATP